ncbi:hypothetical protein CRE_10027 [Caenorhabditis remanei]|uniref:Uncharacterized protein n=1 Tax=Caenorhabditis remanei TaxID=31234 RepID=E3M6V4_CAERE|nr:hypothetical protein CRE_10027 [Caenorhabditis remanei]
MSANAEYGLKGQTPDEYNQMIERMKTDTTLFNKYFDFFFRNHYRRSVYDGLQPCTTQECRNGYLCDARQFHQTNKLCTDLEGQISKPKETKKKYSARFVTEKSKKRGKEECKI